MCKLIIWESLETLGRSGEIRQEEKAGKMEWVIKPLTLWSLILLEKLWEMVSNPHLRVSPTTGSNKAGLFI